MLTPKRQRHQAHGGWSPGLITWWADREGLLERDGRKDAMARRRVSRLQKRILRLFVAEHRRTQGGASSSYYELVKALGGDKSNISHSLRTLEEGGWIVILRTPGGQANAIDLTPEGLKKASEI